MTVAAAPPLSRPGRQAVSARAGAAVVYLPRAAWAMVVRRRSCSDTRAIARFNHCAA